MMGYGAGLGLGYGGLLTLLGCAALLVGIVVLIAWALGKVGPPVQSPTQEAPRPALDALDVLRHRFARGELTADEYSAARQVLEADR